jgi:hypothetical protein
MSDRVQPRPTASRTHHHNRVQPRPTASNRVPDAPPQPRPTASNRVYTDAVDVGAVGSRMDRDCVPPRWTR